MTYLEKRNQLEKEVKSSYITLEAKQKTKESYENELRTWEEANANYIKFIRSVFQKTVPIEVRLRFNWNDEISE